MANRLYAQNMLAPNKAVTKVFATVAFDGSGVPTLEQWPASQASLTYTAAPTTGTMPGWQGVESITKNGTGDYTFLFQDGFPRLLNVTAVFQSSTGLPSAPIFGVKSATLATLGTAVSSSSGAQIELIFTTAGGGSATAVTSCTGFFEFTFQNSSAV